MTEVLLIVVTVIQVVATIAFCTCVVTLWNFASNLTSTWFEHATKFEYLIEKKEKVILDDKGFN